MAVSTYRGFKLKSSLDGNRWKVEIKSHVLQGSLTAVKKSIDWWCDTASIIDPKEFASLQPRRKVASGPQSDVFCGYTLKNDTGEPNAWYCMFNGKLLKGSKAPIQRHIENELLEKRKTRQNQRK